MIPHSEAIFRLYGLNFHFVKLRNIFFNIVKIYIYFNSGPENKCNDLRMNIIKN